MEAHAKRSEQGHEIEKRLKEAARRIGGAIPKGTRATVSKLLTREYDSEHALAELQGKTPGTIRKRIRQAEELGVLSEDEAWEIFDWRRRMDRLRDVFGGFPKGFGRELAQTLYLAGWEAMAARCTETGGPTLTLWADHADPDRLAPVTLEPDGRAFVNFRRSLRGGFHAFFELGDDLERKLPEIRNHMAAKVWWSEVHEAGLMALAEGSLGWIEERREVLGY